MWHVSGFLEVSGRKDRRRVCCVNIPSSRLCAPDGAFRMHPLHLRAVGFDEARSATFCQVPRIVGKAKAVERQDRAASMNDSAGRPP
jgi:hypothetical protein